MNVSMIKRIENKLNNWLVYHLFLGVSGFIILYYTGLFFGLIILEEILGIPFDFLFIGFLVIFPSVLDVKILRWIIQKRRQIWNQRQLLWDYRCLLLVQALNLIPYYLATWWVLTLSDEITHFWLKAFILPLFILLLLFVLSWPIILYTWPKFKQLLIRENLEIFLEVFGGIYFALIVLILSYGTKLCLE